VEFFVGFHNSNQFLQCHIGSFLREILYLEIYLIQGLACIQITETFQLFFI